MSQLPCCTACTRNPAGLQWWDSGYGRGERSGVLESLLQHGASAVRRVFGHLPRYLEHDRSTSCLICPL
jgi:hypothetical protein